MVLGRAVFIFFVLPKPSISLVVLEQLANQVGVLFALPRLGCQIGADVRLIESSRSFPLGKCRRPSEIVIQSLGALGAPAEEQAVEQEQNDGADHRGKEPGCLARPIPIQCLPQVLGDDGARNAKQRGDDETARIFPG